MSTRPPLSKSLSYDTFLLHYYLKEELVAFCKANYLSSSGGKQIITNRVAHFLKTGEKLVVPVTKRKKVETNELSLTSLIEDNFICSEKHRAFFKEIIGVSFSFNVTFQEYLKSNAGKPYSDAVTEWYKIQETKKNTKGTSKIDSQFEYNTYIRDFFKANKDKTLKEAIMCWNFKKGLAGHHKYEAQDLVALNNEI